MKRRYRYVFVSVICCAALLTGCFGGREVNERAFVQLMGIENDGEIYTVSLQLYKGESSSGTPDISKSNSEAVSGSGATVPAALAEAELEAGKSLYMGHIKLLILGEGIKEPAKELSCIAGDGRISPSCPVVYSPSPSSVTGLKLEDGLYSSDRLMQVMRTYVSAGKCVYTSYASLAESTALNGASAPLPMIKASEDSVDFEGMMFASSGGISGGIPEEDAAGLMILNGNLPKKFRLTFPVTVGDKTVSAAVTKAKVCRSADISDGRLRINAQVKLRLDAGALPDGVETEEAAEAVCRSIRDACISAYSSAVWYGGNDVFGLYRLIRRDCPSLLASDRETVLRGSILNVSVKAYTQ